MMEQRYAYQRGDSPSSKWFRNFTLLSVTAVVLWIIVPPIKGIILLFLIALVLSYLLEPAVSSLENRGIPRVFSIIILFISIGILLSIAGNFLFIPLKNEIVELRNALDSEKLRSAAVAVKDFVQKTFPFIDQNQIDNSIQEMITSFRRIALDLSRSSLSLLQSIFSVITQIIIIPLVAFFILKDGPTLKRKMANLVPNKYFEMVLYLLYKTDIQIGNFVRGQIVVNMILAVFYSVGFYFLDIPFYIVLGVFSGLANIIPYIGPIIGITPPIIVAVMESAGSFALIPWIVVLFAVIQIVDNTLLQPTIVARSVDLHPLIIIFAVLTGGQLLGLAGMLFSVLLAGIIKVVIVEAAWSFQNYNLGRTFKRREDTVFIAK